MLRLSKRGIYDSKKESLQIEDKIKTTLSNQMFFKKLADFAFMVSGLSKG